MYRHYDKIKKYSIITGKALLVIVILFISLNYAFPVKLDLNYSKEIYASDGTLMNVFLNRSDKWRLKVKSSDITPQMIKAIINKEDKWFYYHPGVNLISVFRAFYQNVTTGKRISGASTITMQLARMLEPADRNYYNKIAEILRAIQIEVLYSKETILNTYLSLLPYGGNIEGVKAASYLYFNRPPEKLSLSQCVSLAMIPNDPNRYRIDRKVSELISDRNYWLNKFGEAKVFPQNAIDDAIAEKIIVKRYRFPSEIPHLARRLQSEEEETIFTTINPGKQSAVEKILKKYVNANRMQDVSNGAVLVLNNRTGGVEVYCGSSDFYDDFGSGQVDGVTAVRSPGSALKPFLYSFVFDKGAVTPTTKLLDVPTDFGGYAPDNYDNKFNGWVSVRYALLNSLNVPAVNMLSKTGVAGFIKFLSENGFRTIKKQSEQLGLSVILGGCGTTLEELVTAFSAFGKKGKYAELNYTKNIRNTNSRLYSESSAYLIYDILKQNERPDLPHNFVSSSNHPEFAWKTGTSYGKRDAWAIGFNRNYTVGVWLGNFSGKGSPFLNGADMAVPLLFEIFNYIDYNPAGKDVPEIPEEIEIKQFCRHSGLLPGRFCENVEQDYLITNVSVKNYCTYEKEIYTDSLEQIRYCTECLPKNEYRKVIIKDVPPELKLWLSKSNKIHDEWIPHNPDCSVVDEKSGLKIVSPQKDYEYYIQKKNKQQILLEAVAGQGVRTFYWYIDNRFTGKSSPDNKLFFTPDSERHIISCVDDRGGKAEVTISVKYY